MSADELCLLDITELAPRLAHREVSPVELTQAYLACTPVYDEQGEGPAHQRTFTSIVTVNGETVGTGSGSSKKAAQQRAAAQALTMLRNRLGAAVR